MLVMNPSGNIPYPRSSQQASSSAPAAAAAGAAATATTTTPKAAFTTCLGENDVLVGRGAPSIDNEGNRRFRKIVASRKEEYFAADTRQHKESIARQVVSTIAMRQGRFLRKIESLVEAEEMGVPPGVTSWACVDSGTVLHKVKQALRDRNTSNKGKKAAAAAAAAAAKGEQSDTSSTNQPSPPSAANKKRSPVDTKTTKQASGSPASPQKRRSSSSASVPSLLRASGFSKDLSLLQQQQQQQQQQPAHQMQLPFADPAAVSSPRHAVVQQQQSQQQQHHLASLAAVATDPYLQGVPHSATETERVRAILDTFQGTSMRGGGGGYHRPAHHGGMAFAGQGALGDSSSQAAAAAAATVGSLSRGYLAPSPHSGMIPEGVQDVAAAVAASRFASPHHHADPTSAFLATAAAGAAAGLQQHPSSPQKPSLLRSLSATGRYPSETAAAAAAVAAAGYPPLQSRMGYMSSAAVAAEAALHHQQQQQQQQRASPSASIPRPAPVSRRVSSQGGNKRPREDKEGEQQQQQEQSGWSNKIPRLKSGSSPTSPRQSPSSAPATAAACPEDTTGDRAIRLGFEKHRHHKRRLSTEAEAGKRQQEAVEQDGQVQLSLTEMLILMVVCSHGLPVWTPTSLEESFVSVRSSARRLEGLGGGGGGSNSTSRFWYTWSDFASLLAQAAKDWYERTRSAHEITSASGSPRRSSSHRSELSVEARAIELAAMYMTDTKELAKKTISLLEKLRKHGQVGGLGGGDDDKTATAGVESWLTQELGHWASSLQIARDFSGRPIAFTASDFVAIHPQHGQDDAVSVQCIFDSHSCRDVYQQVACLSRLRGVCLHHNNHAGGLNSAEEIRPKLDELLAASSAGGSRTWTEGPSWWDTACDSLLLDRLLTEGFLGVLEDASGFVPAASLAPHLPPHASLRHLGLTKHLVQERMKPLVLHLHEHYALVENQEVFEDRIHQYLGDMRMVRSQTTTASSAPPVPGASN